MASDDAAPTVTGELVEPAPATVAPDQTTQNAAADRARGRTSVQVGVPTSIVIIGTWAARLAGIDLNPLPGVEDMPPEVVGAFVAILAVGLAFRMNPKT